MRRIARRFFPLVPTAGVTRKGFSTLDPPPFASAVPSHLPSDFQPFTLCESWPHTRNTKILRFELPDGVDDISALGAPSGVKIRREIAGHILDKSYSPISHPTARHIDLLVKAYPPSPGAGTVLASFSIKMRKHACV